MTLMSFIVLSGVHDRGTGADCGHHTGIMAAVGASLSLRASCHPEQDSFKVCSCPFTSCKLEC